MHALAAKIFYEEEVGRNSSASLQNLGTLTTGDKQEMAFDSPFLAQKIS